MTQQSYDGPKLEADEVARISGDLRITAGAPVTVILRKVDNRPLSMSESAVDVLPGRHTLLVDCRVQETSSLTRHSIDAEVFAGRHYRLVPEMGPGLRDCVAVHLEAKD